MKIQVETREVYGNRLIYPVCEKAKTFARIANQKTLTNTTLNNIKALGYEIYQVNRPLMCTVNGTQEPNGQMLFEFMHQN